MEKYINKKNKNVATNNQKDNISNDFSIQNQIKK